MSLDSLCKSTLEDPDVDAPDAQGYDLYLDMSGRSSEKCVAKLSSLPSHYGNQYLVHHQGQILQIVFAIPN